MQFARLVRFLAYGCFFEALSLSAPASGLPVVYSIPWMLVERCNDGSGF